jgi:hypothetical protein
MDCLRPSQVDPRTGHDWLSVVAAAGDVLFRSPKLPIDTPGRRGGAVSRLTATHASRMWKNVLFVDTIRRLLLPTDFGEN